MECLCQRFPHLIELVLENLEDNSFVNCKEASREISEFLPKERFYWIRIIKHYNEYFGSFENSWKQVIDKTPVTTIKELAVEVQQVFSKVLDISSSLPVIGSQIVNIRKIAPLHIAADQGNLKLCEHILEKTEDKNPKGDMEMVYAFNLDRLNCNSEEICALTPLGIAALKGHFEICTLIMDQICVEDFKLHLDSETPLHLAARAGHFKIFKVIMEFFREQNPPDAFGQTPLHLAAQYNHLDICELILSKVDNIHPKDDDDETPFDYALIFQNLEIVKLFESFKIKMGKKYIWIK